MMRGSVTDHHIEKGREDCSRCPIERSLQDIFKKEFTVGMWSAYHWGDGTENDETVSYRMTPKVSEWIRSFDDGIEVKPFEFEINGRYIEMTTEKEDADTRKD